MSFADWPNDDDLPRIWLQWIACAEPERPPDRDAIFHRRDCRLCVLKANARADAYPSNAFYRAVVDSLES